MSYEPRLFVSSNKAAEELNLKRKKI